MKIIFEPLFGLALVCAVAAIWKETGAWKLDTVGLGVIVIMLAPPNISYCCLFNAYKKQPLLTSNLTLIATLFSIISLPFWVIITTTIGATPLFS